MDLNDLIERLRGDELDSLESDARAGRREHALKALDERGQAQALVRQQHAGRYPFELLQNANDAAADTEGRGRVRFVLTETALVVADNGSGFGEDQIRAICGLGRSSKDPRKSVGYKGLGFKSVGEITDRPQVFSARVQFGFDEREVRSSVGELAGVLDERQRLPVYAFPLALDDLSLGPDAGVVEACRRDGLTTVFRLPLKDDVSRADVGQHLEQSLLPRLLLFLSGVEELELVGTSSDFTAVSTRERHDGWDEVLLEAGEEAEHWTVHGRSIRPGRALIDALGPAWSEVEEVSIAVAVPLDHGGRPSTERLFPIHVYFPTEEATGLPVVVQGDFALQMDRKQLDVTPEATPYNEALLNEAASLLAEVVAPTLSDRFPGTGAGVRAITPRAAASGLGRVFIERLVDELKSSRFLPAIDGKLRTPAEALLLPSDVASPAEAHEHLGLEAVGRTLIPEVEVDARVRGFVSTELDVSEMATSEALAVLRAPEANGLSPFYEFLVAWSESAGNYAFANQLAETFCVHTAEGEWVSPGTEPVFFPRQRDDVVVPADIPVPIVDVPEVKGLRALLSEAGVRDFEWRELLREYLLPELTSEATETDLRERAMKGLRAYFESQRSGDPVLGRQIGRILLPAALADGDAPSLRAANATYFSEDWLGADALERLYGPFEHSEFLAAKPPEDPEERKTEREFLEWVGVASRPRILEAVADARGYKTENLIRHPHRVLASWDEWWTDAAVQAASECPQGHPASQQLRRSFAPDRFEELVGAQDATRLEILWQQLAVHWGASYQPAMEAFFSCHNANHAGERDRPAPSLFAHMLTNLPWVPARRGDKTVFVTPREAWRLAPDTPNGIVARVPVLPASMASGEGLGLATALGVIDAARPRVGDLARLLTDLCQEHEVCEEDDLARMYGAARWAMRTLNEALMQETDVDLDGVPLLARHRGELLFTPDPVVADDPLLAETWEEELPILDADRNLTRLYGAAGLVRLDDPETGVRITPVARGPADDIQRGVAAVVAKAKPYLAAVAVANTPSREPDVLRGLTRLEVVACSELLLRCTFRAQTLDRPDATAYIAERTEHGSGAIRRKIGTAYLEVSGGDSQPDWYSFGPLLAQFLVVPTLGDAFSMVLSASASDRAQYLSSRRITQADVDAMRVKLNLPIEDELPPGLFGFDEPEKPGDDPGEPEDVDGSPGKDDDGEQGDHEETGESAGGGEEEPTVPELDPGGIDMEDADPGEVDRSRSGGGPGGVDLGPTGPVDHERTERKQREIGKRGELAAFEAEKLRVEAFGGDPTAVTWRSKRNPLAPWDIESLDSDGQRIYIEVKSTVEQDPARPFPISRSELLQALRHRSRYYVYRVTAVNDTATPPIKRYQDPAQLLAEGKADVSLMGATMRFGDGPSIEDDEGESGGLA